MGQCPACDLYKVSILENRCPAGFVYVTVMLLGEPYEGATVDRGGSVSVAPTSLVLASGAPASVVPVSVALVSVALASAALAALWGAA